MSNATALDTSWAAWSLQLPRTDNRHFVIIACILPVLCLVHSFHMHGKSTTQVRVISDTAAVFQFLSALAFLDCKIIVNGGRQCGVFWEALVLNVLSDVLCGGMVLACDFWLTYSRYKDLRAILSSVGITDDDEHLSRSHRIVAFLWVVLLNFVTWVPFETIFPFFADTNTPAMHRQWIVWSWVNDAAMVRCVQFSLLCSLMDGLFPPFTCPTSPSVLLFSSLCYAHRHLGRRFFLDRFFTPSSTCTWPIL
jgi:hypothetical protein